MEEYTIEGKKITPFIYAHSAYKISELGALTVELGGRETGYFDQLIAEKLDFIIGHFLQNHYNKSTREVAQVRQHLGKTILAQFSSRVSLFAIIHCFDLITTAAEPCTVKVFGMDPGGILRNLNKYLNYCRNEYEAFIQKLNGKAAIEEEYYFDKSKVSEMPQQMRELSQKLKIRYPDEQEGFKNLRARLKTEEPVF